MKNYIEPNMEVIAFRAEDIITTSSGGTVVPPAQTGINVSNDAVTFDGTLETF